MHTTVTTPRYIYNILKYTVCIQKLDKELYFQVGCSFIWRVHHGHGKQTAAQSQTICRFDLNLNPHPIKQAVTVTEYERCEDPRLATMNKPNALPSAQHKTVANKAFDVSERQAAPFSPGVSTLKIRRL